MLRYGKCLHLVSSAPSQYCNHIVHLSHSCGGHVRLNASHEAAEKYIGQFPSPLLSHGARFVAFIAGSFAALLLGAALVDDQLLERRLGGRTLVW
jgi:Autophagy protein ATG9